MIEDPRKKDYQTCEFEIRVTWPKVYSDFIPTLRRSSSNKYDDYVSLIYNNVLLL